MKLLRQAEPGTNPRLAILDVIWKRPMFGIGS